MDKVIPTFKWSHLSLKPISVLKELATRLGKAGLTINVEKSHFCTDYADPGLCYGVTAPITDVLKPKKKFE